MLVIEATLQLLIHLNFSKLSLELVLQIQTNFVLFPKSKTVLEACPACIGPSPVRK